MICNKGGANNKGDIFTRRLVGAMAYVWFLAAVVGHAVEEAGWIGRYQSVSSFAFVPQIVLLKLLEKFRHAAQYTALTS